MRFRLTILVVLFWIPALAWSMEDTSAGFETRTKNNQPIRFTSISANDIAGDYSQLDSDFALSLDSFTFAFQHASEAELEANFGESKNVREFYKNLLSKEDLEPFMTNNMFWVRAFIDDKLVGWMSFQFEPNKTNSIYLSTLVVAPEYHNLGIGKIFIRSIVEHWQPTATEIKLVVRNINNKALGFYRHLGFVKDLESDCENCIGMKWVNL
jgi:ribosomal protein S18 acetylase RimI-like enzyme